MPKRSCPFADAAPLQLKVHVGPKELSQGVFAERYSREVFGECGLKRGSGGLRRTGPRETPNASRAHGGGCCFGKSESEPSPAERTSLARERRRDWARVGVKADAALSPLDGLSSGCMLLSTAWQ